MSDDFSVTSRVTQTAPPDAADVRARVAARLRARLDEVLADIRAEAATRPPRDATANRKD